MIPPIFRFAYPELGFKRTNALNFVYLFRLEGLFIPSQSHVPHIYRPQIQGRLPRTEMRKIVEIVTATPRFEQGANGRLISKYARTLCGLHAYQSTLDHSSPRLQGACVRSMLYSVLVQVYTTSYSTLIMYKYGVLCSSTANGIFGKVIRSH